MKKKTVFAAIALAVVMLVAFTAAGCTEEKKPSAPVFGVEDALTADINTYFTLPDVVATRDGVEYPTDVAVKDSEGAAVEVVAKKFFADDENGYTATYSAAIDEQTYTKDVKIAVGDKLAPTIVIDADRQLVLNVGDTYTIPVANITATDNSGKTPTVTYSAKHGSAAVTLANNSFEIEETGDYTVTVTATDEKNNTATETIEIQALEKGIIADFENGWEVDSWKLGQGVPGDLTQNTDAEFVRTGSASLKYSINHIQETWPLIYLDGLDDKALDEDSVSFSMWVFNDSSYFIDANIERNGKDFRLLPHCWNFLEVKKAQYDEVFREVAATATEPAIGTKDGIKTIILGFTYSQAWANTTVNLYFDDIRINYEQPKTIYTLDATMPRGQVAVEYTIPAIEVNGSEATATARLYGPDGTEITLNNGKFTPDEPGQYLLAASAKDENGEGWNVWIIRIAEERDAGIIANFDNDWEASIVSASNNRTTVEPNDDPKFVRGGSGRSVKMSAVEGPETWPGLYLDGLESLDLTGSASFSLWIYNNSNTYLDVNIQRADKHFNLKPYCWNYLEVKANEYDNVFMTKEPGEGYPAVGTKESVKAFTLGYTYESYMGELDLYIDDIRVNETAATTYTLKLTGENAPQDAGRALKTGLTGQEYTIGALSSEDCPDGDIAYTLYGPDRQPVTVSGTVSELKFTPTAVGVYVLAASVTGTDGEGWDYWTIAVIGMSDDGLIAGFEDASEVSLWEVNHPVDYPGCTLAYNTEAQFVHSGSGSMLWTMQHGGDGWPGIFLNGLNIDISDASSFSLWVYNDSDVSDIDLQLQRGGKHVTLKARDWTEIVVNAADFDTVFTNMEYSQNDNFPAIGPKTDIKALVFNFDYYTAKGTIKLYFDDIRVTKAA